jgi:hypothetical protein
MVGAAAATMESIPSPDQDLTPQDEVEALISQLEEDRAWLLEQIDRGHWQHFRLDLAALERELGQLLQRASERCNAG